MRDTLGNVLAQIHAQRPKALERFNGDSSGFQDVEAALKACVQLGQTKRKTGRTGMPLILRLAGLAALLGVSIWAFHWWQEGRAWDAYVARLRVEPGIVITDEGRRSGRFMVAGLRDPLAVDPQAVLRDSDVDLSCDVADQQPGLAVD